MSAAIPLFQLHATNEALHFPDPGQPISPEVSAPQAIQCGRQLDAPKPELAFYRKYTEAMLRRYMRLYLSTGRMPSLLGHDACRGKMSTYRVTSFEDSVIFVYDVEKCLAKLDAFSRELIRRIAIQEYTQGETAGLLGVSLRTIVRRYGEAVDRLTQVFMDHRLLDIDPMNESSESDSSRQ